MNVIFAEQALQELYETGKTKDSKYKILVRDKKFVTAYIEIVALMYSVENVSRLKEFSFLHYEQLRHRPESSVRIVTNRIERLLFTEHEGGVEVKLLEINLNHYGHKR